jgi:hypothetical protein
MPTMIRSRFAGRCIDLPEHLPRHRIWKLKLELSVNCGPRPVHGPRSSDA